MHIGGMGDAKTLAAGVKAIYSKIDEVRASLPQPQKMFGLASLTSTNRRDHHPAACCSSRRSAPSFDRERKVALVERAGRRLNNWVRLRRDWIWP